MSAYTINLRNIIYHYSQDINPFDDEYLIKDTISLKNGETITTEFVNPTLMSLSERIKAAMPKLLPEDDFAFRDALMRQSYFRMFVTKNIRREIEYETVQEWIAQWHENIHSCLDAYNALYGLWLQEADGIIYRMRKLEESYDETGREEGKAGNTTASSGSTTGKNTNESLNTFDDMPESELKYNRSYATNQTLNKGETNSETASTSESSSDATSENERTRNYSRIVTEKESPVDLNSALYSALRNRVRVISEMVDETSERIFLKIY